VTDERVCYALVIRVGGEWHVAAMSLLRGALEGLTGDDVRLVAMSQEARLGEIVREPSAVSEVVQ
jgi:hypothetical protein